MHYGTPKPEHIEMYTRVLKGHIGIASLIFPAGTKDARIDIIARRSVSNCQLI